MNSTNGLQTEPALIYDSVHVFAIGLQSLETSHSLVLSNVTCEDELPWDGGLSLINYINTVSYEKNYVPSVSHRQLYLPTVRTELQKKTTTTQI